MKSRKENAWVRVYEAVRDRITDGMYSPGEKLNERDISEMLGVSRTPIREALKVLESEGYVTNYPKKGVTVKKYSPHELDALHRMLLRLEGLSVEMAIPNLGEAQIHELEELTERMTALAIEKKYGEYLKLNFEFHTYLSNCSGSSELFETVSLLRKRIFRFYHSHITLADNSDQYVKDHQDIVHALKGNKSRKAVKLMEEHIEKARVSFLEFYSRFSS